MLCVVVVFMQCVCVCVHACVCVGVCVIQSVGVDAVFNCSISRDLKMILPKLDHPQQVIKNVLGFSPTHL